MIRDKIGEALGTLTLESLNIEDGDGDNDDDNQDDDDIYIMVVCISVCNKKVTSSWIVGDDDIYMPKLNKLSLSLPPITWHLPLSNTIN